MARVTRIDMRRSRKREGMPPRGTLMFGRASIPFEILSKKRLPQRFCGPLRGVRRAMRKAAKLRLHRRGGLNLHDGPTSAFVLMKQERHQWRQGSDNQCGESYPAVSDSAGDLLRSSLRVAQQRAANSL